MFCGWPFPNELALSLIVKPHPPTPSPKELPLTFIHPALTIIYSLLSINSQKSAVPKKERILKYKRPEK